MDYQKFLQIIEQEKQHSPKRKLLLQACCAPCSTAVLEQLNDIFAITILFYNPNITIEQEYQKRKEELKRFLKENYPMIQLLDCDYDKESYLQAIKGHEQEKEGSMRCYLCYQLRLEKTAVLAKTYHYDYFGTTLSISPYKKSTWLNEIGKNLEEKYQIHYLYADFKKKNGYRRSIELSSKYHLYRQDYCGCIYSKIEREQIKAKKDQNQE